MTKDSFLERTVGQPLGELTQLTSEQRAGVVRGKIHDLHFFFDEGRSIAERAAPPKTRQLAQSLFEALTFTGHEPPAGLAERIITDDLLRREADRDQNVYLGPLFTRRLTRAVPDLVFQPASANECSVALAWARRFGVPITLRGAASTAMGGAVPNDGGLTLDLSRLETVEIDAAGRVAVIGAGARLRTIHQTLAQRGLALSAYPSNLGGTLVGWFVTGGIGLNAFARGRALDTVRAADVLLPGGEHLRFHDDGRLDVPEDRHRRTLPADEAARWFESNGYAPLTLADLAGSEGALGLVLQVSVKIEPRPAIGAFLLSFESEARALEAAAWIERDATRGFGTPANVKLFSASHLRHVRAVWADEATKAWRAQPSAMSTGERMLPWTRIVGPAELGAPISREQDHGGAYLFVDFLDLDAARAFARGVVAAPGAPQVLEDESVRIAAERFKPQQSPHSCRGRRRSRRPRATLSMPKPTSWPTARRS
ncbi:MAG: FAD-binding oxidoreductase [Candidatus Eisenbacteria bacterium]|uniref:FAD-binding oxidoreductase n=1 Tax=Eiseniibacteriota bacterium TaxID=2212470 RepID=A0A538TYT4_UNCEI|nr:MAG: FAD-binding oxidoreductase [Candidatus Eisenbacteria bacterium]